MFFALARTAAAEMRWVWWVVVRARTETAGAVLGAVTRAPGLDEARVAAEARVGLRGDAAEDLHEPDDDSVALDEQRVAIVALQYKYMLPQRGNARLLSRLVLSRKN